MSVFLSPSFFLVGKHNVTPDAEMGREDDGLSESNIDGLARSCVNLENRGSNVVHTLHQYSYR